MRRAGLLLVCALLTMLAPQPTNAAGGSTSPWWFDAWQVDSLWADGADGRGITIAVIDTGVQASIPELTGRVLAGVDLIGNGTDGRTDFDAAAFSHGTAMASLMVARPGAYGVTGLVPAARVLPIAIPLQGVTRHGTPPPDATAKAIRYAADQHAKIISMSLGATRDPVTDAEPCPSSLQRAIDYAVVKGSLVVAASGNSATSGSPVEEPGVCLGVVSVGAVNPDRSRAGFSSTHPYLTLAAPGSNIATLSREPGAAFLGGGTSQATALAAAAIALVWSKVPTETSRQVLSRILSTTTDLGPPGRDDSFGAGLVNPAAALGAPAPRRQARNVVLDGVAPLLALDTASGKAPVALPVAGNPTADLGVHLGNVGGRYGTPNASTGSRSRFVTLTATAVILWALAAALIVLRWRRRAVG